jgi:hypothetical protein
LDLKEKKNQFIEIKFFIKDKKGNSGGEKETWGWKRNIQKY